MLRLSAVSDKLGAAVGGLQTLVCSWQQWPSLRLLEASRLSIPLGCAHLIADDGEAGAAAEERAREPAEHCTREGVAATHGSHEERHHCRPGALAYIVEEGKAGEGDAALVSGRDVAQGGPDAGTGHRGEEATERRKHARAHAACWRLEHQPSQR